MMIHSFLHRFAKLLEGLFWMQGTKSKNDFVIAQKYQTKDENIDTCWIILIFRQMDQA